MVKPILAACLVLALTSCSPVKEKFTSSPKTTETACKSCTYETNSYVSASLTSTNPPQTPAFTIAELQAFNSTNTPAGVTWSYGTNEFWATSSTKSIYGHLDSFGFLDSITTNGQTCTISYTIDGFISTVSKVVSGVSTIYLSFVYDAAGTQPIGYMNHETGQYVPINTELNHTPQQKDTKTFNISYNEHNDNSPKMMTIQANSSECQSCYNQFNNNMDQARRDCGICTTSVLALFVYCEAGSAGIGTPLCFSAWVIGNAACIATYLSAEQAHLANLADCLSTNVCPPIYFLGYPKIRQPAGGR